MTFTEAKGLSRMTFLEISVFFELTLKTVMRYHASDSAPKSIIVSLQMIGGQMPSFSRRNDFTGWSFGSGFLWSPAGDKFTSGDVQAGKYALLEMNRLHRIEVRERNKKPLKTAQIILFPARFINQKDRA